MGGVENCGLWPRDLANVKALKNHIQSLLLHKNYICYISRYFLHYFVSPFHQCLAKEIFMDYAHSRAGQNISHEGSNSVAPLQHTESCVAVR